MARIQEQITRKVQMHFKPLHLEVSNESHLHKVPENSETHFKVVIVAQDFVNRPLLDRQRLVNKLLHEELNSGVHALSMQTLTPEEWEKRGRQGRKSPPCLNRAQPGSQKDTQMISDEPASPT